MSSSPELPFAWRSVFDTVPAQYQARYKIEVALNCFCANNSLKQQHTVIYNLDHVKKETKLGFWPGVYARYEMYREVYTLLFDLYVFQTWRWREVELPAAEYDLFE